MGTMTDSKGTKSLIRHIFPVYQSIKTSGFDNGNFAGFVPEDSNVVSMLVTIIVLMKDLLYLSQGLIISQMYRAVTEDLMVMHMCLTMM